jgi:tetratricopeptide (TPR) repeat protein
LDALKQEIGTLYKSVEAQIGELTTLKGGVLALVEKWKSVRSRPTFVPQFTAAKPSVRADHIGASTFIEKGWSKIAAGDHAAAEEALAKALELSPDDPAAGSLMGWAQMLQDKLDDALLSFQRVLVREPQNALARVNVGYICLKKQIFGEAIEHLSRAIRLDNDKKATIYAHFYLGLVYLEREMYEDAQTFFQKTIALGPNLLEAQFELGRAYWFNGQQDDATRTWQTAFDANKFNPWGKRCGEALESVKAGGNP